MFQTKKLVIFDAFLTIFGFKDEICLIQLANLL